MPMWIASATKTIGGGIWSGISGFTVFTLSFLWDTGLAVLNLILPRKAVTATAWPPFVPRTESDSRSPCPGVNALAAHGILPHNGRNIKFKDMAAKVQQHYNCSASLCFFVCNYMAGVLHRDYNTGTLDLGDMCVHNGIEHDGSMTRFDTYRQPDQSVPAEKLVLDLLAASHDGKKLTAADFSRILTTRRGHSKAKNPQFSLDAFHSSFGAGNAATLLLIFGGDVADIRPFLLEERIPEGWTSRVRSRMGLTMARFNAASLRILLGVHPSWKNVKLEANA